MPRMIPQNETDMRLVTSIHGDAVRDTTPCPVAPDELTIANALPARGALLAWLESPAATLDLANVTHIDGAGLQLLLMVRREADRRALAFEQVAPSRAVASVLQLARLDVDLRPIRAQRRDVPSLAMERAAA